MLNSRSLLFEEFYKFLLHLCFVRFGSVTESCPTLCNALDSACQVSLSLIISTSLLKLMSIELVMPSNHLFLCCPPSPFSSCLQSFSASGSFPMSWFFSSGGQSIGVPSKEHLGLISVRIASLVAQTVKRLSTMRETRV